MRGESAKHVDVRFASGEELLGAYWGYLGDGGLVLADAGDLSPGDTVRLRVTIESSGTTCELGGHVVRGIRGDGHAVVAFEPGEPHDMLLTAALAETDDVPPRRFQRFSMSLPARVHAGDLVATGTLTDLSAGGCCVCIDAPLPAALSTGEAVRVAAGDLDVTGTVVWARGRDRGICFDPAGQWAAQAFLDRR
ncbi:MAG: PilZ domain-containing protein [Deltaproteobacteria bacterium]|nr:MAG: PilZ domain-containing protein [Deltaproteobacteria bacterium]